MAPPVRITPEKKAYVRLLRLHQNMSIRRVASAAGISKSSVWRICNNVSFRKGRTRNRAGRPEILTERQKRGILRRVEKLRGTYGNFTVGTIMRHESLDPRAVSRRTVSRFLNKSGFKYCQARKKGLMYVTDLRKRLTFA